jgi:hypothetical protein
MATPRVFISSTCYDLKYIRENLRYFIKTLGYEPILSEDGAVYYNPTQHTHDACLTEIPNCQLFVLIIGGRFGGRYHKSEHSITNTEYREAIRLKIPVFALVESSVYYEHHLYRKNTDNRDIDLSKLTFPSVDSPKIFEFIDEVRSTSVNNAIVPFRDFGEMESYLRQQWAGMMFDFLSSRNEEQRVADTLSALAGVNERIEMLSKQILASVGTEDAKVDAKLYEALIGSEAIRDLSFWKLNPTPVHVLANASFRACAKSLGITLNIKEVPGIMISSTVGELSRPKFVADSNAYTRLRQQLKELLKAAGTTAEFYLGARPKVEIRDDDDDVEGAPEERAAG